MQDQQFKAVMLGNELFQRDDAVRLVGAENVHIYFMIGLLVIGREG